MPTAKRPATVEEAIAALRDIDSQKAARLVEDIERWRSSEFPPGNAEALRLCILRLEAAERLNAFVERKQISSSSDHARLDDDGAPPRQAPELTETQYRALVAKALSGQKKNGHDL